MSTILSIFQVSCWNGCAEKMVELFFLLVEFEMNDRRMLTIAVNSVTSTGWKEGWLRFGWSASLGPNLPCLASNKHLSPMFKENGSRMLQTSTAAQAWSAWSYLQCWVWGIFFSYCGTTISKCLVLGRVRQCLLIPKSHCHWNSYVANASSSFASRMPCRL